MYCLSARITVVAVKTRNSTISRRTFRSENMVSVLKDRVLTQRAEQQQQRRPFFSRHFEGGPMAEWLEDAACFHGYKVSIARGDKRTTTTISCSYYY